MKKYSRRKEEQNTKPYMSSLQLNSLPSFQLTPALHCLRCPTWLTTALTAGETLSRSAGGMSPSSSPPTFWCLASDWLEWCSFFLQSGAPPLLDGRQQRPKGQDWLHPGGALPLGHQHWGTGSEGEWVVYMARQFSLATDGPLIIQFL